MAKQFRIFYPKCDDDAWCENNDQPVDDIGRPNQDYFDMLYFMIDHVKASDGPLKRYSPIQISPYDQNFPGYVSLIASTSILASNTREASVYAIIFRMINHMVPYEIFDFICPDRQPISEYDITMKIRSLPCYVVEEDPRASYELGVVTITGDFLKLWLQNLQL